MLGGSKNEQVCSLHQLPNGNYIVVHNANSEDADLEGMTTRGGKDIWITQLTVSGKLLSMLFMVATNDDIYASVLRRRNLWLGGTTFSENGDITTQRGQGGLLGDEGIPQWGTVEPYIRWPRPDGINDMLLTQDGGRVLRDHPIQNWRRRHRG